LRSGSGSSPFQLGADLALLVDEDPRADSLPTAKDPGILVAVDVRDEIAEPRTAP
jgi:hypothetical protein